MLFEPGWCAIRCRLISTRPRLITLGAAGSHYFALLCFGKLFSGQPALKVLASRHLSPATGATMFKPYVLFLMVIAGAVFLAQSSTQSTQDASKTDTDNQQNVFRKEVKLVSVYFAVRDSKK